MTVKSRNFCTSKYSLETKLEAEPDDDIRTNEHIRASSP